MDSLLFFTQIKKIKTQIKLDYTHWTFKLLLAIIVLLTLLSQF